MFTIMFSTKDKASRNIKKHISPEINAKLVVIDKSFLDLSNDEVKELAGDDMIIFASKHQSEKKVKSLTVHTSGLFDQGLSKCNPYLNTLLLKNLKEINDTDYDVTFEVTHHTPIIENPSAFIEIGSTEDEWNDPIPGKIVAQSIENTINNYKEEGYIGIGIGGPHYAPNFTRYIFKTNTNIGHICAKYALEHLTKERLNEMIDDKLDVQIIVDWKGLGQHKAKVKELLEGKDFIKIK